MSQMLSLQVLGVEKPIGPTLAVLPHPLKLTINTSTTLYNNVHQEILCMNPYDLLHTFKTYVTGKNVRYKKLDSHFTFIGR